MSFAHASNAIAGFYASTFVFNNTPWDRFLQGDDAALDESELAGARDFLTVGCSDCHHRSSFAGDFHNTALPQFGPGKTASREDFGREAVTGLATDRRRFLARPLRNVELTAPYGHLGQFATLATFVNHYNNAPLQLRRYEIAENVPDRLLWPTLLDNVDEILATADSLLDSLRFGEETHANLVAFLLSLTDDAARDLRHTIPDRVPQRAPHRQAGRPGVERASGQALTPVTSGRRITEEKHGPHRRPGASRPAPAKRRGKRPAVLGQACHSRVAPIALLPQGFDLLPKTGRAA